MKRVLWPVLAHAFLGVQGGDLRKALARDTKGEYAWSNRGRQVALDITRGLHFLHMSGVMHRYSAAYLARRGRPR